MELVKQFNKMEENYLKNAGKVKESYVREEITSIQKDREDLVNLNMRNDN